MSFEPPKGAFNDAFVDGIRSRANKVMKAEGMTVARLARKIGIPEGTLGPWLNAKYAGDNLRVAQAVEKWLIETADRAAQARATVKAPDFQLTGTAEDILRTLDHAQMHGKLVLVALRPGSGKSISCAQQQELRNRVYLATMRPSTSGVATSLGEVLAAMGEPDAKGSPARLAQRICSKVREPGALIMIDEAQHLSVPAIEELRAIQDETRCGMALVGDERLTATFDSTSYAQLRRRIARRCPPVKNLDGDARILAEAWKVTEPAMIHFLQRVARKPGALGGVNNVMEMATQLATAEARPIALDHLQAAWRDLMPEVAL